MYGAIFLPQNGRKAMFMDKENMIMKKDTVIKLGKVNYVVKEQFSEKGKQLDELLEKLVVDKYKQSA